MLSRILSFLALLSFSPVLLASTGDDGHFELARVVGDRDVSLVEENRQDGFHFEGSRRFGNWDFRIDYTELRSRERLYHEEPSIGFSAYWITTKLAEAELGYTLGMNDWNSMRFGLGQAYKSEDLVRETEQLPLVPLDVRQKDTALLASVQWLAQPLDGLDIEVGIEHRGVGGDGVAITAALRYWIFEDVALGLELVDGQGNELLLSSLRFGF